MNTTSTIQDFIELGNNTREYLEKYFALLSNDVVYEKINELQACIKTLQAVSYKLADVSNTATRAVNYRKLQLNATSVKKFIDPYPTEFDIGTILFNQNPTKKTLVPEIELPVKYVENITEIPTSHLYYVKSLNSYAINVEGINLVGNLGNITSYQSKKTSICEYGTDCRSFKNNVNNSILQTKSTNEENEIKEPCKYYHDPRDFIFHNVPVLTDSSRNFTPGSWIYSNKINKKSNYFTRHVGNGETLNHDINQLKRISYKEEVITREHQLIHDLLVYLALISKNMVEKHKKW